MTDQDSIEKRLLRLEESVDAIKSQITNLRDDLGKAKVDKPSDADWMGKEDQLVFEEPTAQIKTVDKTIGSEEEQWKPEKPERKKVPLGRVKPSASPADKDWDAQYWLNRIGIGLFLFGVAFFFKYSIDQGWITPLFRIVFGFVLGSGLIVIGSKVHEKERRFGAIMSGGGTATLYITIFAAYQIFHLFPYPVAFGAMVGVTLLTFFLSLKQNEGTLSCLAAIGGMATPFILFTGQSNLSGLTLYTLTILFGSMAVYFFRGWRSLLWVSSISGALVFSLASAALPINHLLALGDRYYIQAGVIIWFLLCWLAPIARLFLLSDVEEKWPSIAPKLAKENAIDSSAHLLFSIAPLVLLALSTVIWQLEKASGGYLSLGLALIFAMASWRFGWDEEREDKLERTHAFISVMFFTLFISLTFEDDILLLSLGAEGLLFGYVARKISHKGFMALSHVIFMATAFVYMYRFVYDSHHQYWPVIDLVVIGLVYLASLNLMKYEAPHLDRRGSATLYKYAAFLALVALPVREFHKLPNGAGMITISWAVLAVALLLSGFFYKNTSQKKSAMVMIAVVVGKLFLVDLSEVDTIWRILLFLIFGSVLLGISYYSGKFFDESSEEEKAVN